MELTKLTAQDASNIAVATLGLDADATGLSSPEGLAASLRRAASFMCPTSPDRLVDAVFRALRPLHGDEVNRNDLVAIVDQLVASGDLLELCHENGRSERLLYLAPPSYIERVPGTYLLTGVRPFGAPLIGDKWSRAIKYERHTRVLTVDPIGADDELRSRGLQRVPKDRWVASPKVESPHEFITRHRVLLDRAAEAGELDGLKLIDPTAKVHYYRGRWRAPDQADTGDYVSRRPQAYGADLWCLIRFRAGHPQRVLEFPVNDPEVPGRDEAWRYQAAVDALRGAPQQFHMRRTLSTSDDAIIDFFSPLPSFAERYVQFASLAPCRSPGALFSFRLPAEAIDEINAFLTDILWMTHKETNDD